MLTPDEQFFYDHAGFSYHPERETAEEGHLSSARLYAKAEHDARNAGFTVAWAHDPDLRWDDDSQGEYTDYDRYVAIAYDATGQVVGSLSSVDFGPDGSPHNSTYARVVSAEMAADAGYGQE